MEQQRAEQEQKQLDEARRKQKEQAQRIKTMLEASFDGDIDVIKKLLTEVTCREYYALITVIISHLCVYLGQEAVYGIWRYCGGDPAVQAYRVH